MAIRKTIQIGNPKLKAPNQEVTDFNDPKVKQVIQDLKDSMHNEGIIGMAAPQIGENVKIFVTEPRETDARPADQADQLRVYINPKITYFSEEKILIYEGCGSVSESNLFGPVTRPKIIEIEAYNEKGEKFKFKCDGILSRVIQHEYDHMNGIEFLEKVDDYKKMLTKYWYIQLMKSSPDLIKNGEITIKEYSKI
jgi:peptide deformylase